MILDRAAVRRNDHAALSFQQTKADCIASASNCASAGGTNHPVCPMMYAASPTSVETQGVSHAIASAITLGKPSAVLGSTCRSSAFIMAGTSLRCPSKSISSCRPYRINQETSCVLSVSSPRPTNKQRNAIPFF